jgi:hypothetical protein
MEPANQLTSTSSADHDQRQSVRSLIVKAASEIEIMHAAFDEL